MMNNKKEWDTASLGVTYQMSLDAFLKDSYHASYSKSQAYEDALMKLKEMRQYRGWQKKKYIAHQALLICRECIEAYLAMGLYCDDM